MISVTTELDLYDSLKTMSFGTLVALKLSISVKLKTIQCLMKQSNVVIDCCMETLHDSLETT